jgi:hypothetical protein
MFKIFSIAFRIGVHLKSQCSPTPMEVKGGEEV